MNEEIGNELRAVFLEALSMFGTEFDVGGRQRPAIKQQKMKEGFVVLQFADAFSVQAGDRIRESKSELHFDVVDSRTDTKANVFNHFEVTTESVS